MRSAFRHVLRKPYYDIKGRLGSLLERESLYQQMQRQMVTQYKLARLAGIKPYATIAEAGFRCYSQMEEDGIILYVLSMIGFTHRTVVEICCGHGHECMTTNLILNHGFRAYLFDGDAGNVEIAKRFFARKKDCIINKPTISQTWVTAENINDLLRSSGVSEEIDFLSLDIDGNDYWVWKAMDAIRPRLCVFETHSMIPSDLSLTIGYDPQFNFRTKTGIERKYRGASLAAMVKLSREKGYRLIGAHRYGFNAFFLRNDIAQDIFPEISAAEVHNNPWTQAGQKKYWPLARHMNWVEV